MPSSLPMIAVRLPADEKKAVEKAAKAQDRSVSSYIRLLLREALKKGERDG